MKRARRPAGLRAMPRVRSPRRSNVPLRLAEKAVAASARLSLASLDIDTLRRVHARRGGSSREFTDGTIELLAANGERIARAPAPEIEHLLRSRLEAAP